MSDFVPGDRILFRDGDRFGVALVDIVKPGHLTAFPYDTRRQSWMRANRRIGRAFVLDRLSPDASAAEIAKRIHCLGNQRDAKRQQANRWLENNVRQLIEEAR